MVNQDQRRDGDRHGGRVEQCWNQKMKTRGGDTGMNMIKKTDEGKRKSTEMLHRNKTINSQSMNIKTIYQHQADQIGTIT